MRCSTMSGAGPAWWLGAADGAVYGDGGGQGEVRAAVRYGAGGASEPELRLWRRGRLATKGDLYAPRLDHVTVTMDFVGYT